MSVTKGGRKKQGLFAKNAGVSRIGKVASRRLAVSRTKSAADEHG
jgi:hypothetical protein